MKPKSSTSSEAEHEPSSVTQSAHPASERSTRAGRLEATFDEIVATFESFEVAAGPLLDTRHGPQRLTRAIETIWDILYWWNPAWFEGRYQRAVEMMG